MAKPMFTRDKGADQVPQQIKELQDAATQNAGAVKQLAGEMQRTLASLQQGASQLDNTLVALQQRNAVLERELRRANRFSLVAAPAALLAFELSAYELAACGPVRPIRTPSRLGSTGTTSSPRTSTPAQS